MVTYALLSRAMSHSERYTLTIAQIHSAATVSGVTGTVTKWPNRLQLGDFQDDCPGNRSCATEPDRSGALRTRQATKDR